MNGAKWVSPLRGALVAALCAYQYLSAKRSGSGSAAAA